MAGILMPFSRGTDGTLLLDQRKVLVDQGMEHCVGRSYQAVCTKNMVFQNWKFFGDWTIDTLPIYPLKFHGDEETRTSLISELTERGHRWKEVVTAVPPLCRMHTGVALPYRGSSLASGFGDMYSNM